jgi:hypothetical protein
MTSALRLPRTELRTPLGRLLVYSAFTEAKSSAAACCFVSLEAAQASNCQRFSLKGPEELMMTRTLSLYPL